MKTKFTLILIICFVLFSCKTYTIPPNSFKEQFIGIDSTALKSTQMNSAFPYTYNGLNISYNSNHIKNIYVIDKKGNKEVIANSPAIEMRVTLKNNKKYYFYFDTVVLQNDTLTGGRSRFMPKLVRKIPFDNIVKIEVQDGGKNMKYSN
ncbi:MAG: hypothetical protein GZ087_08955 [Flavobacterium sp.]|nr:hypothetical protein [Flavobacterium sp.]